MGGGRDSTRRAPTRRLTALPTGPTVATLPHVSVPETHLISLSNRPPTNHQPRQSQGTRNQPKRPPSRIAKRFSSTKNLKKPNIVRKNLFFSEVVLGRKKRKVAGPLCSPSNVSAENQVFWFRALLEPTYSCVSVCLQFTTIITALMKYKKFQSY